MKLVTAEEILAQAKPEPIVELSKRLRVILIYGGASCYKRRDAYEIDLDGMPDKNQARWALEWLAHLTMKTWFTHNAAFKVAGLLADEIEAIG